MRLISPIQIGRVLGIIMWRTTVQLYNP